MNDSKTGLFQTSGCKEVRWASRLAAKISRSRVNPTRSVKKAKHVKPVKQTVVSLIANCKGF